MRGILGTRGKVRTGSWWGHL